MTRHVPRGRCPSGKVRYSTRKKAIKALDQIRTLRNRANGLMDYRQECAYYKCPIARCDGWHLTSREQDKEEGTT